MPNLKLVRLLAAALAVGAVSTGAWAQQPDTTETVAAWSTQLWQTAKAGDASNVDRLLRDFPGEDPATSAAALKSAAAQYGDNLAKRESDRSTRMAEVRADLTTRFGEVAGDPHGFKLGQALVLVMELVELRGGSLAAADLFGDPLVAEALSEAYRPAPTAWARRRRRRSSVRPDRRSASFHAGRRGLRLEEPVAHHRAPRAAVRGVVVPAHRRRAAARGPDPHPAGGDGQPVDDDPPVADAGRDDVHRLERPPVARVVGLEGEVHDLVVLGDAQDEAPVGLAAREPQDGRSRRS